MNEDLMSFETVDEVLTYFDSNYEFVDNFRVAFVDDKDDVEKYHKKADQGCCGFVDIKIYLGGRLAYAGCNYGH